MDAQGRHIWINCEGEGNEPPVSVEGLAEFVAAYLRREYRMVSISHKDVAAAISAYENGER